MPELLQHLLHCWEESGIVWSLAAVRHRAQNDKWIILCGLFLPFKEPLFRCPIWFGLRTRQHKFFAISYSNSHLEFSKQTFYLFTGHGVMNANDKEVSVCLISSDKVTNVQENYIFWPCIRTFSHFQIRCREAVGKSKFSALHIYSVNRCFTQVGACELVARGVHWNTVLIERSSRVMERER